MTYPRQKFDHSAASYVHHVPVNKQVYSSINFRGWRGAVSASGARPQQFFIFLFIIFKIFFYSLYLIYFFHHYYHYLLAMFCHFLPFFNLFRVGNGEAALFSFLIWSAHEERVKTSHPENMESSCFSLKRIIFFWIWFISMITYVGTSCFAASL